MAAALPSSARAALQTLSPEAQRDFQRDYGRRSKSLLFAYLAWFLLGWHYLYMGRIGMQFAFWFTLGFLIVGWFVDFFRLPGMIRRMNEDTARALLGDYKTMHQQAPAVSMLVHSPPPPSAPVAHPHGASNRYFCFIGDQVCGPYAVTELRAMRTASSIDDSTQCCAEGSETWVTLGSFLS
jgi:hypothetical protein